MRRPSHSPRLGLPSAIGVVLCLVLFSSLHVLAESPPQGFTLQKRERVDQEAEGEASYQRMIESLTRETRQRREVMAVRGGHEVVLRLCELTGAKTHRENQLLQPADEMKAEYKVLLKKKLSSDPIYQERMELALTTKARLSGDTSLSTLLDKHRIRIVASGTKPAPSDAEVMAAIRETEDRAELRELLVERKKISDEVWRLKSKAEKRRREMENSDPELVALKNKERDLRKKIRSESLPTDPELLEIEADIAAVRRKMQSLLDVSREE